MCSEKRIGMTGTSSAVIFHPYFSEDYAPMLELIKPRHTAYTDKWGFDLLPVDFRKLMVKADVELVQAEMVGYASQLLSKYNYVVWLDLDTLIWDMDVDLRTATDEIGAVRFHPHRPMATGDLFSCHFGGVKVNHLNCGAVYIKRTSFTLDFMDEWAGLARQSPGWYSAQNAFNILTMGYGLPDLDFRWNYNYNRHGVCRKPVVKGYHGYRGLDKKMSAIESDLRALKRWQKN